MGVHDGVNLSTKQYPIGLGISIPTGGVYDHIPLNSQLLNQLVLIPKLLDNAFLTYLVKLIMILHKQSCQETWYDILNVKESASYEDIRGAYRSALLNSHPDKQQNSSDTQNSANESSGDRFMKVQRAWETLSDSRSRVLYDAELRAQRTDEAITADEISLADMAAEEGEGDVLELYYQCRCGDYFSVSSFELEEEMGYRLSIDKQGEIHAETPNSLPGTIILPCESCSLKVRLVIDLNSGG